MLVIGLIKEGKIPADNRVALTPSQCKWLIKNVPDVQVKVEHSPNRCYTDQEYAQAGVELTHDLSDCNLLLGIKEVPVAQLIPNKRYMFFSHTKKLQPYNRGLMQAMVQKNITLIDYECLEHKDGQRIIGFGFFAGIVGAHNGIMAYGNRTGAFSLERVHKIKDYRALIHTYFGLKLPPIKIAVTGSGRVAHGILEIMNLLDVQEVEPDEYLSKEFDYPVYVHLKGSHLYQHKTTQQYNRDHFHEHPEEYNCLFLPYCAHTDVLMNGIYWGNNVPRLFEMDDLKRPDFRIQTIADITDDKHGSVPCNLGDATIDDPVYGVNVQTGEKTVPYIDGSIDIMAVGNLPNELPRDASRYFGEQLIKYILDDIRKGGSNTISNATILENGQLTEPFHYLKDYAALD
ncbi:NAD(P)-dependent oxidoreductase [Sediminibacterium sp. TEGAF015]|uniref:NAD(P)-dependent oxidoreductase n=1 Tax=Sediminibacterium sp. TEGAF015 TaxID=575378 RepID=UPI00220718AE|nr:NAD(P)-dependent oxidoreductase [Sediminibacterium sp. TEGAF015]BDQ11597.1 alanine dehydrogenase [Sediminibacterium sp. TEGAF015]